MSSEKRERINWILGVLVVLTSWVGAYTSSRYGDRERSTENDHKLELRIQKLESNVGDENLPLIRSELQTISGEVKELNSNYEEDNKIIIDMLRDGFDGSGK